MEVSVVICFHFTIFVVLETTPSFFKSAFASCDLLSFYYLCRTRNNGLRKDSVRIAVVICFHFTIFVVLETTDYLTTQNAVRCDLLSFYYLCRTRNNWAVLLRGREPVVICFHFTIFVVLETTLSGVHTEFSRCDLLSFYYLCRTRNNFGSDLIRVANVVICFHFTIFVVLETTYLIRKHSEQ